MSRQWFVYDPENWVDYFNTEDEALSSARDAIDSCLDESWNESVEGIIVGKVTHVTQQANVVTKDMLVDGEYGGRCYPGNYDHYCDYVLEKVEDERTKEI